MVAIAAEPSKPRVLATLDYLPRIVKLADESFSGFFLQTVSGRPTVMIISSRDGGETWTPPMGLLALSTDAGGWLGPDVLAGADGEVHLFLLNDANSGVVKTGEDQRQRIDKVRDKRLDIWHLKSSGGRKQWPQPRRIWT